MSESRNKISFEDFTDSGGGGESTVPDYASWKEAKIRKALEEAKDRSLMITAQEVWKRFGIKR